jgi:molybdopterin/thiamine biosynthesis adenylyltransferase
VDSIRDCRLFMIGAGAIGCELLKNYAMIGLGTGSDGKIVVTDPDVIEVSNLNRQFLFREKHLRKPKSSTAAAAAIQMNPDMKGHIEARLDKIHDGTAHIYDEEFFRDQTIVTNALDNVQARLYIDSKCVASRSALIDSGTLGPKGHVQIILPEHLTESYASQRDPDDNGGEIPHCTLKMFPEETLHCVEWAKDKFGQIFDLQPKSFNKFVVDEKDREVNFADQQEKQAVKKVIKLAVKHPKTFEDCVKLARSKFQKYFVNDILQLLHVYPVEKLNKDGRPFWSLPKRPPRPVDFDPTCEMHQHVVSAFACLYATVYGVKIPHDKPRSKEAKAEIAKLAATFEQSQFVPNDQKATEIASEVDKEKSSKETEEQESGGTMMVETGTNKGDLDDVKELQKKFQEVI